MGNFFAKFLNRPKLAIPAVLVVAVVIGVISLNFIGQTPTVSLPANSNNATSTVESTSDSVDLAFAKAGRLYSVPATVGRAVSKGDVLASLDAGDALGAVNQAKGALGLAKAQYASLDVQYANAKKQQDVLVANAYRTLLSSNLTAVARKLDRDSSNLVIDNSQIPQITGTYVCGKEGAYEIYTYPSQAESGYSFNLKGVEKWGSGNVTYYTPQALGTCGLFIQFPVGYNSSAINWIVDIPNTKSASYAANKNAYDLAVATRDQVLKQFEANLGQNGSAVANIAQAAVDSAQGAYEVALANYRNNLIVAPMAGVVTFVDSDLKVGQTVGASKTVITITKK